MQGKGFVYGSCETTSDTLWDETMYLHVRTTLGNPNVSAIKCLARKQGFKMVRCVNVDRQDLEGFLGPLGLGQRPTLVGGWAWPLIFLFVLESETPVP